MSITYLRESRRATIYMLNGSTLVEWIQTLWNDRIISLHHSTRRNIVDHKIMTAPLETSRQLSSDSRWWEFYVVRYGMGEVARFLRTDFWFS